MVDIATRNLSEAEARRLEPGSEHYMAYVGPADQYDLMSATQFRLLTTLGLRSFHRLLDFGCGSLRGSDRAQMAALSYLRRFPSGAVRCRFRFHPGPVDIQPLRIGYRGTGTRRVCPGAGEERTGARHDHPSRSEHRRIRWLRLGLPGIDCACAGSRRCDRRQGWPLWPGAALVSSAPDLVRAGARRDSRAAARI